MSTRETLEAVQAEVRRGNYRFTEHGLVEATADDLAAEEVRDAILSLEAEVIEDYPDNPRGPSCLILGWTGVGQPVHVVASYPPDVAIITVYRPGEARWQDSRTRRRP